jgi:hypothetical protein
MRRARGSLAVSVCLALGVLLMATGTTLGISGMAASVGPAVQAQYPDATALAPPPDQAQDLPAVTRLADITREMREDPAQVQETVKLHPRVFSALAEAVEPAKVEETVREYGPVPLLLSGMIVLAVGGVLRARRRPLQLP